MLRCECGHKIGRRDLLQVGVILRPWKPVRVLFRFRCPRCGREREEIVDYTMLAGVMAEIPQGKEERLKEMGPITTEEVEQFRKQLEETKTLPPEFFSDLEEPKEGGG